MDIAELTLVGGHPALDLVNTVERGVPAPGADPRDFLTTTDDLVVWARRAGVLTEAETAPVRSAAGGPAAGAAAGAAGAESVAGAELGRVRELREALHLGALARLGLRRWDEPEVAAALDLIGRRQAEAAGRSRLRVGADGALVREVGTELARLIGDRLADAAVDLLTGADVERVRRCPVEQGGCGWLFLDRSKNRSRTWCRMADCGNAVKARRLTERRRQARTAEAPAVTAAAAATVTAEARR